MSATRISIQLGHCLPTKENLDMLLKKLVEIFDLDSASEENPLSTRPTMSRTHHHGGRMSGSDFHIRHPFWSSPQLEAILQFETDSGKLSVPLCHIGENSEAETSAVEQVIELLRSSWPNATVGPLQRGQFGNDIYHPESPGNLLFQWLGCKEINPKCEGIHVDDLWVSEGRLHQLLDRQSVSFFQNVAQRLDSC